MSARILYFSLRVLECSSFTFCVSLLLLDGELRQIRDRRTSDLLCQRPVLSFTYIPHLFETTERQ